MAEVISLSRTLEAAGASAHSLAAVERNIRVRVYDAAQSIMQQGDINAHVFYLTSGLAKLVYLTPEGKAFVKSFIDAGHLIGSLVCLLEGRPSPFSIICLEPARVESMPYAALQRLADQDIAVLKFTNALYRDLALKKEIREHDFLCLSAEERYGKFIRTQPQIVARISQAEIARYLGITPVALSRIKSRLKAR